MQDNLDAAPSPGRASWSTAEAGRLAGGDVGAGRLAEPATIVGRGRAHASAPPDLDGLPRAGHRRRHPRAASTRSGSSATARSGKQGYALAEEAAARGAKVTLVTTTVDRPVPPGVDVVAVETRGRDGTSAVLARAAVGRRGRHGRRRRRLPARPSGRRARSRRTTASADVVLEPTPDILADLGAAQAPGQMLVGFAAETADAAWPTPRRSCAASDARPHRRQRRVGPRASASSTTPTRS